MFSSSSDHARPHHRPEDQDQVWEAELGRDIRPTVAGGGQGQGHRLLLRQSRPDLDPGQKVRRVQLWIQEGNILVLSLCVE